MVRDYGQAGGEGGLFEAGREKKDGTASEKGVQQWRVDHGRIGAMSGLAIGAVSHTHTSAPFSSRAAAE